MSRIQKYIKTLSDSDQFMMEWQNGILGISWADLKSQITATLFTGDTITVADLVSTDTTDATTSTTGAIITAGGIGVAKAINIGTTATVGTNLIVSGTTDSTTSITGSITTAGGLGVVKAVFIGTTLSNATAVTLATVSGITTIGATTPATVSTAGVITVANATDSTTSVTGALIVSGGLGIAKAAFIGTNLSVVGATDATTSTTGSLQTAGGLGVAKAIFGGSTITSTTTVTATTGVITPSLTEKTANAGIVVNQVLIRKHTTQAVVAGSTILASFLQKGYLTFGGGVGSITLDTAANLGAALGAVQGTVVEFFVDNTAGSGTATVVVAAGIVAAVPVITGGATLTIANSATQGIGIFRLVFSSPTAAVLFRLG